VQTGRESEGAVEFRVWKNFNNV